MLGIFLAHPTEACAGGFQSMAPVSNASWWRQIASVTRTVPGETESSSAELQLDKGYLGRQCTNGAAGPRRTGVRRGLFFQGSSPESVGGFLGLSGWIGEGGGALLGPHQQRQSLPFVSSGRRSP